MSEKPPEPWRNDITMDTRLTAIDGVSSISDLSTPKRVKTVGDAISSVKNLNLSPYNNNINTVEHAFSIEYNDCEFEGISCREDFNICLFLTFIGNTEAYNLDKSECNTKEQPYQNILCSSCNVNTRAISRKRDFSPLSGVTNTGDVRSVFYIEDSEDSNKYLFVDKDISSEYKINVEGLPEDSGYCLIPASYINQFASLFGYNQIKMLAKNSKINHEMPIKIKDKESTTHVMIAPLMTNSDFKEPLLGINRYTPYLLL